MKFNKNQMILISIGIFLLLALIVTAINAWKTEGYSRESYRTLEFLQNPRPRGIDESCMGDFSAFTNSCSTELIVSRDFSFETCCGPNFANSTFHFRGQELKALDDRNLSTHETFDFIKGRPNIIKQNLTMKNYLGEVSEYQATDDIYIVLGCGSQETYKQYARIKSMLTKQIVYWERDGVIKLNPVESVYTIFPDVAGVARLESYDGYHVFNQRAVIEYHILDIYEGEKYPHVVCIPEIIVEY